jgi:hypothetical protein
MARRASTGLRTLAGAAGHAVSVVSMVTLAAQWTIIPQKDAAPHPERGCGIEIVFTSLTGAKERAMRRSLAVTMLCGSGLGVLALVLAGTVLPAQAGDEKVHTVGKDGLKIEGKVEANDPKVKIVVGPKSGELPATLHLVKLSAGKAYRVTMDSDQIDSVLVVQNKDGKQLAWDDDSGGMLNSLLTLNVLKDGTYKVYTASLRGAGNYTLNIKDLGAVKVHEVKGDGLKLTGEIGKTLAIPYNVKLTGGKTYVIDMVAKDDAGLDPFLRLLNADGDEIAKDDDSGGGLNARIRHKIEKTGTYQVIATCFIPGRGEFTLTVAEAPAGDLKE